MRLYTWLMHMTKKDFQNQRRSWMLFFLTSHLQMCLSLYWETRLTYLMLPQRMSFDITWASLTSPQARARLIWLNPMFVLWRFSCAVLSARWGMVKAFSGSLSTLNRIHHACFYFFIIIMLMQSPY